MSGPKIVYCGKPRRGIPPIDEKDRVVVDTLLLIDVCAYDMLVVLLFAIVEDAAARKKVDEGRVDDDGVDTTSRRKALDIVDIITIVGWLSYL